MSTVEYHRIKPDINVEEAYRHIRVGILLGAASLIGGFFVLAHIVQEARQRHILLLLVYVFFLITMLAQLGMCVKSIVDGVSVLSKRRRWLAGAVDALAEIKDREHTVELDYDDYKSNRYVLLLRIDYSADHKDYSGRVIQAVVSKRIYNKYAYMDVARVHYLVSSPLTFLFRGE